MRFQAQTNRSFRMELEHDHRAHGNDSVICATQGQLFGPLHVHLNHVYSLYPGPPQHIVKGFCINFLGIRMRIESTIFGQRVGTDSGMVIKPRSSWLVREGQGKSPYILETIYGDIIS